MVLGFLVHSAPTSLRVCTSFGPVVNDCASSILAGCQQSVSFTRGLLWELMDKRSKVDPEYPRSSHVDDLSHVLVGESASDLKAQLLAAGRVVGKEVARLQLELSDNSKLIPDNQLTGSVAKTLAREGLTLKVESTYDDAGVQQSGSTIRKASSLNHRIECKGADRAARTHALVMVNPAALKLTMTGMQPVQEYGHQAQGASNCQLVKMRRN